MRYLRKDSRITFSETRTKAYLLVSFLLPGLILLVIAYKFGLYPFSDKCFATDALRNTYFPVIAELRRKILEKESLFYSWNAGGGVNFWAWISAYASSPFVLLYLLVPEKDIASMTQIIFALKASFASLSLFLLLWKKENVVSPVSIGLSTAYGLCGYVLTYSQEPWLLDIVILLPVLILTLNFLIRGRRPWAFSIVCAFTGIACAKAGIYLLIFILAMFPLLIIEDRRENEKCRKFRTVLKDFFLYFFFGVGLSAFMWFPAWQAFWNTSAGMQLLHVPQDLTMELKAWDVLDRACFDSLLIFPSFENQSPSIYCGIVPIIFLILYGFSSRIRFTEKIYIFCTMVVLYISMSSKILQYVFLGFHFPITGVYPQAILITFLIMYASGRLLSRGVWFDERAHVHAALGMMITFMLIRSAIAKDLSYADYAVYMAILFLGLYFILILNAPALEGRRKEAVISILALTMIVEAGLGFYRPIKEKYYHAVVEREVIEKGALDGLRIDPSSNPREKKETKKVYKLDDTVIYPEQEQTETSRTLTAKAGLAAGERILVSYPADENYNYGFRDHFATLASDGYMTSLQFARALYALGVNRSPDETKILPGSGTPVTDILLRQGRLIDTERELGSVSTIDNAASNGFFFVSDDEYSELLTADSPFVNQDELAYRLTGTRPFTLLHMEAEELENMKENSDYTFSAVDPSSVGRVILESRESLSSDYTTLYFYIKCDQTVNVEASLRNDENEVSLSLSSSRSNECIRIDVPRPEGWRLCVKISLYSPGDSKLAFYAACPDREEMAVYENKMSAVAWEMSSWEDGKIEGSIDASEAGTLLFNVPDDEGWTAVIDGQRTETFGAYKTFLAVHVPAGYHEISLQFVPKGFVEAVITGGFAVVLLILLSISKCFPNKKNEKKSEEHKDDVRTERGELVK